jgi:outer membrane receptor protein involved in Fe transport
MISGPLIEDGLAFRLAADRFDGESFTNFTGPQAVDDVEDDRSLTVRGKLLFAPKAWPDFSSQLTVAYQDTRRPQSTLVDRPFDERERAAVQTAFETESIDLIWDIRYALTDNLTLLNRASYANLEFRRLDDPAIGQVSLDGPQITNETLLNFEEPRLGLSGVSGVYIFHEDRTDSLFPGRSLEAILEDETLTTSVFGEVTWEALKRLRFTLGGRYEREARERVGTSFGIQQDLDEVFDAFLPKFGVAYDVTETATVGATVSRGLNAGGGSISFGARDAADNPSPDPALGPRAFTFDSEFVWNYEIYGRASALDRRLNFSGNLFYSDYRDQQRVEQLNFPGGFTDFIIVNSPDSRAYGAEFAATYLPIDELELFADIGLLTTEIQKPRDPDLEGNEFARAPNLTTSFGAVYRPTREWMLSVDARYAGSYFSTDTNNPLAEVDPHFLANAKVAWQPTEHVRVFGSVTNIFDSDAETRLFSFPETALPSLAQLVDPRVFWIGAEVRF